MNTTEKFARLSSRFLRLDTAHYEGEDYLLIEGDCREQLLDIQENSIHLAITDPPYFLDGLDADWNKGRCGKRGTGSVGGLPVGMKFDPKQGVQLQMFMTRVGEMMFDALVPGAFAIVFSQPRLIHRMASSLETVGFEIRDGLTWHFTRRAQFKAFSMDHFIDRMDLSPIEKNRLKSRLNGRKTPQLRPQFELMVLAQKPREGTHIENWLRYETGLMDSTATLDGKSPTTHMTVEKPQREIGNRHLTVKPVRLIEHLIKLFSLPGQVVLDPFLGSGTTMVAALKTDRRCIGIEINPEYMGISRRRIENAGVTR